MRPMFGPLVPSTSITWVSAASLGNVAKYGLAKRVEPVKGCRSVGKKHMKFNDTTPKMAVDPESYRVEADGKVCEAEPAEKLPLGQAYYVF
jgi:urease